MSAPGVAVFAADLHLQAAAWKSRPSVCGDAYCSFEQIVALALQHNVPLILGGDIFDSKRPESRDVLVYLAGAAMLASQGLSIYYVQGDHDCCRPPWPALAPNAVAMHGNTFNIGGMVFGGLDWAPTAQLAENLAALSCTPVDWLVTHEAWQELQGIGAVEGRICEIPAAVRCGLLTGDYHKHVVTRVGNVNVFSPGSVCMQAIDESPEKAVFLICEDGSVTSVKLNTREAVRVRLREGSEAEVQSLMHTATAAAVRTKQGPLPEFRPLISVQYPADMDISAFRGVLEELAEVWWEPVTQNVEIQVDYQSLAARGGFAHLEAAVVSLAGEGTVEASGLCRLLRTRGSIEGELAEMEREYACCRAGA